MKPSTLASARYTERMRERSPEELRLFRREAQRRFRESHPEKKSAWNKVYKAVKSGSLVRPGFCSCCGIGCKTESSHEDYAQPLEVEWLCKRCHTNKDFPTTKELN